MDLPPLPKNVVFVLDSSASMVGTKLRQVSPCMCYRLGDFKVVESLFQASSYQMDSSPLCIKVQCCQNWTDKILLGSSILCILKRGGLGRIPNAQNRTEKCIQQTIVSILAERIQSCLYITEPLEKRCMTQWVLLKEKSVCPVWESDSFTANLRHFPRTQILTRVSISNWRPYYQHLQLAFHVEDSGWCLNISVSPVVWTG